MIRHHCSCCGYPTIEERNVKEICLLCDWEDQGIAADAEGDACCYECAQELYTIVDAREHFRQHYTMHRERHILAQQTGQELDLKRELMNRYDRLPDAMEHDIHTHTSAGTSGYTGKYGVVRLVEESNVAWQEIAALETELREHTREMSERYNRNLLHMRDLIIRVHSDVSDIAVEALLELTLHAEDLAFAQEMMERFSEHEMEEIRGMAVRCFGHLARVHGTVNQEQVLPRLNVALGDDSALVRLHAQAALEDIEQFVRLTQSD